MRLTQLECKNAKPNGRAYKLADGCGMFLLVNPNGAKYWRLAYRYNGRQKTLALGVYPNIALADARKLALDAKKNLQQGIDPAAHRIKQRLEQRIESECTFQKIAEEWINTKIFRWSKEHVERVRHSLRRDVYPDLGAFRIDEISPGMVLAVLRKVEGRDALELASRIKQRCSGVFRYGVAIGAVKNDVTRDLTGVLKTRTATHYNCLTESELPEFLAKLDRYDGRRLTQLAIRLLMLTFVRTGELRAATWSEFDLEKSLWRIPPEKMKMGLLHLVPLSCQACDVIRELQKLNPDSDWVFPNHASHDKCMSENTILYALYRMGYHSRATGHGFRSTASTILNEHGFVSDFIERQLAHSERNQVRAAYNHAEYLEQRKIMMQWWADHLDRLNVSPC